MNDKTFGQRLQEEMEKNYISTSYLSNITGIDDRTIRRYKRDEGGTPRPLTIKKLADALDTTVDYLLDGKTSKSRRDLEDYKQFITDLKTISTKASFEERLEMINIISGRKGEKHGR